MSNAVSQHLYRWYSQDDKLLYVGVSTNAYTRAKSHAQTSQWWPDAAKMTLEIYEDRASVLAAEKAAIQSEKPLHNVQHQPKPPKPPKPRKDNWWRDYERLPWKTFEYAEGHMYNIIYHPLCMGGYQADTEYQALTLEIWNALGTRNRSFEFLDCIATQLWFAYRDNRDRDLAWRMALQFEFVFGDLHYLTPIERIRNFEIKGHWSSEHKRNMAEVRSAILDYLNSKESSEAARKEELEEGGAK